MFWLFNKMREGKHASASIAVGPVVFLNADALLSTGFNLAASSPLTPVEKLLRVVHQTRNAAKVQYSQPLFYHKPPTGFDDRHNPTSFVTSEFALCPPG
jgi:hypothetical protein